MQDAIKLLEVEEEFEQKINQDFKEFNEVDLI